jgi:hypothetical protein
MKLLMLIAQQDMRIAAKYQPLMSEKKMPNTPVGNVGRQLKYTIKIKVDSVPRH